VPTALGGVAWFLHRFPGEREFYDCFNSRLPRTYGALQMWIPDLLPVFGYRGCLLQWRPARERGPSPADLVSRNPEPPGGETHTILLCAIGFCFICV
jgi:hypothetical protein